MHKIQEWKSYTKRLYDRLISNEEISGEINFNTQIKRESRCITWNIENISVCPLEIGEYLESPPFCTGVFNVTKWKLRLYPKGRSGYGANKAGLFIYRMNSGPKIFLDFTLRQSTVIAEGGFFTSNMCCVRCGEYGTDKWLDSEQLLRRRYVEIVCGMTVGYFDDADASKSGISAVPPTVYRNCTLSSDFEELYNSGRYTDVILEVGKKQFPAHKLILGARSKVFSAMFEHGMKENQTNVVTIEDADSDIISSVLQHIYTGKIDDMTVDKAIQLFQVAEKYLLTQLQKECTRTLLENMTVDNVCRIAVLANIHSIQQLKDATNYVFRNHAPQIFENREWKTLVNDRPLLAMEIMKYVASDFKTKC